MKLMDEVSKLRAKIIAKIDDIPNQVEELVSKEMLVIKRAIIEDLWKLAASKVSTNHTLDNVEENG